MAKCIQALALVDLTAHNVKAGSLIEADAELVKALKASGEVDPHKDAVAYAKSQGCESVRLAASPAADAAPEAAAEATATADAAPAAAPPDAAPEAASAAPVN